LINSSFIILYH